MKNKKEEINYAYLKQKQSLPLEAKIILSQRRIREWYEHWDGNVYVSFSGGKDSTVLLHLVRQMYPEVPAVFSDTGLEYPEIREFVKTIDNVVWVKPTKNFKQVIEEYGYPVISKDVACKIKELKTTKNEKLKNKRLFGDEKGNGMLAKKWHYLVNSEFKISRDCCYWIKKKPIMQYEKISNCFGFTGTMAHESRLRTSSYLINGCNNKSAKRPISNPLSIWLEKDIWEYIKKYNLTYSDIYNKGYNRTGCMFCMFGVHLEKQPNRFQRMQKTHPKLYKYCMEDLGLREVLEFINVPYSLPKKHKLKKRQK